MPIDVTVTQTKSGFKVLRAVYVGDVTVDEAKKYVADSMPGGKFEHHAHLVLGRIAGISREVQKVLSGAKSDSSNPTPVALIIESAVTRLVASAVIRLTGNENTEFFRTEAEGLAFLDVRMPEYERRRAKQ